MSTIYYSALFINNPQELLNLFYPKHEIIYGLHSTIEFKPLNMENIEIGREVQIEIIGRVFDKYGDALLVINPKSKNKFPHITISCKPEIEPVYSNEMIANLNNQSTIIKFKKSYFISSTEGYKDFNGNIITNL